MVLATDLAIIVFFILTPVIRDTSSFLWIDYSVAALLGVEFSRAPSHRQISRGISCSSRPGSISSYWRHYCSRNRSAISGSCASCVLWTQSKSGQLWRPLKRAGQEKLAGDRPIDRQPRDVPVPADGLHLHVLLPLAGRLGRLYRRALLHRRGDHHTGFGDIVLPGPWGKLTSIVAMIIGITLFIRLAQALFRPFKVYYPCPKCALQRHDPDAVHCKACGHLLAIPDEGTD